MSAFSWGKFWFCAMNECLFCLKITLFYKKGTSAGKRALSAGRGCVHPLDPPMQHKTQVSHLKPHCIQSSRVLVPVGTSKYTLRRRRNQGHGVRCWYSDAVTLSSTMCTGGFEIASSALTSSTLKWLHRIQCGFKYKSCCLDLTFEYNIG
jgi:hypothetical protein